MELINTSFEGLYILQPKLFTDERGCFFESYNLPLFKTLFPGVEFQQDNQSHSLKNVVRGLHYQVRPFAQVKLIRVVKGSVMDVVVDIREKSATFGKHFKILLSEKNHTMLWIPEGFAHGFVALEDDSVFIYKCSGIYNKQSERCLAWNDPELNIDWQCTHPVVSDKDKLGVKFKDLDFLF